MRVLEQVVAEPAVPVTVVELLLAAEREHLTPVRGTVVPDADAAETTVLSLVAERVAASPGAPAVVSDGSS